MLQKITSAYIALLLTVFLLAIPRGGYAYIGDFKYSLFLLICGGYVLVIAVLRVLFAACSLNVGATAPGRPGVTSYEQRRPSAHKVRASMSVAPAIFRTLTQPRTLLLLFLFSTILSAIFANYPGAFRGHMRREGAFTIAIYVLSCILVMHYFRPRKWMTLLFGASCALVSLLGLVQLSGANPFSLYPDGGNFYGAGIYYSGQFLSTIGNAGLLAAFLSLAVGVMAMAIIKFDFAERWHLALPLFLTALLMFVMGIDAAFMAVLVGLVTMIPVAVTSRKTLARTFAVFAIVGAAFTLSRALVFTDSGVAFTGVNILLVAGTIAAGGLAVLVHKAGVFDKIPPRLYRVGSAGFSLFAIAAAFVYLWFYPGEPGGMVYEASQVLRGNWNDDFGTRRVFIWRNVLENITLRTLWLGTGPDTLAHWENIPNFVRLTETRNFITVIDAAHNEPLHILATGGLLSLLPYLAAIVVAGINWYRRPDNSLMAVAGAGVLFYVIQAQFGISQFLAAPFFWACFGVMLYGARSS